MTIFSLQTKNTSTFLNKIRHGVDPTLLDLQNFLFTDDIFGDGRQLKNLTFSELSAQVWTLTNRAKYAGARADSALADYAIVGTEGGWVFITKN